MFKNRCYNGGKKHKYEAVYVENFNINNLVGVKACSEHFARQLATETKYVKHVCKWCGDEIYEDSL